MDDRSSLNRKRARVDSDDSESTHPESKLVRLDSGDWGSINTHSESKLIRVNSSNSVTSSLRSGTTEVESNNSDVNSGESSAHPPVHVDQDGSMEVKLIEDELLNILDDSDTVTDRDPAIQDLDSVIKSFEEEIYNPVHETTPGSTESTQPELGYLLEASDDELGLPPSNNLSEESGKIEATDFTTSGSVSAGLDGMLGFEDDIIPSYDSFELGIGGNYYNNYEGEAEYVALGGLFDYSDGGGVSDVSRRTESLSAL